MVCIDALLNDPVVQLRLTTHTFVPHTVYRNAFVELRFVADTLFSVRSCVHKPYMNAVFEVLRFVIQAFVVDTFIYETLSVACNETNDALPNVVK